MSDPHMRLLEQLPHGTLRGYLNEIAFDQKDRTFDDPVKLRFGAFAPVDGRPNFYIAAISLDVLEGDADNPTRREKGFIALRLDPDPTIEVYLQRTAQTTEDADMRCVLRLSSAGLESRVPLLTPAVQMTDRMQSADGRFVTIMQADGNFVTYDLSLGPLGAPEAAIWSAWGGKLQ